jgi:hypothetical protein
MSVLFELPVTQRNEINLISGIRSQTALKPRHLVKKDLQNFRSSALNGKVLILDNKAMHDLRLDAQKAIELRQFDCGEILNCEKFKYRYTNYNF